MDTVLELELEDLVQHIPEEFPQLLRAFASFRRVLRQLLEHGPQVQQRSPVNVTEIHQKQVLFKRIDEAIIPIQAKIPQIGAVWIFFDAAFHGPVERSHLSWKEVATVYVLFTR